MPTSVYVIAVVALLVGALAGYVMGHRAGLNFAHSLLSDPDDGEELAVHLAPLSSSLARMERHVETLERDRSEHFGRLDAQLASVVATGESLRAATGNLAGALNSPTDRGVWGEVQLRRVVEHAGMLPRVDFDTQVTTSTSDGTVLRPDAVVHLPEGKTIVVDAKAPRDSTGLRAHIVALSKKRYWQAFSPCPEFVVCFVPTESILVGALSDDPELLDNALQSSVVVASPATLLALLKTVAVTWQQHAVTENAHQLVDVGRELHQGLMTLGNRVGKLGRTLDRAVSDYNTMVGSIEGNVLTKARRLSELGVSHTDIAQIPSLDTRSRALTHLPE